MNAARSYRKQVICLNKVAVFAHLTKIAAGGFADDLRE